MRSWKTKSGYKIYQVSNLRGNSYLIYTDKGNLLIDTGLKKTFNKLKRNLELLNLNGIDYLILTHTHYDHCQNAAAIKQMYDCKIIMSIHESNFTIRGYTRLPDGTFFIPDIIVKMGRIIGRYKYGYSPFIADIVLDDEISLQDKGFNINIIETAGHSAGSVSVLVDNEIAVVGDAMIGLFKNSIFPPFSDDVNSMIRSWNKLLNTDCNVFLPGHGGPISRNLLAKEYSRYKSKLVPDKD
ncbi:MAG: MBL fold metallo-hydrolase [Bacteroidales bacterium]|nr:MBL fold metallo-hydrolase [Bacteroidales bacterium]